MQLETINKLYLELSQIATAKTKREIEMKSILEDFVHIFSDDIITTTSKISVFNRAKRFLKGF